MPSVTITVVDIDISKRILEEVTKDKGYKKFVAVPEKLFLVVTAEVPADKKAWFEKNEAFKKDCKKAIDEKVTKPLVAHLSKIVTVADDVAQSGTLAIADVKTFAITNIAGFVKIAQTEAAKACKAEVKKVNDNAIKALADDIEFGLKMVWHGKDFALIAIGLGLAPITFGASSALTVLGIARACIATYNDVAAKLKDSAKAVIEATKELMEFQKHIQKMDFQDEANLQKQIKHWSGVTFDIFLEEFTGIKGFAKSFAKTEEAVSKSQKRIVGARRKYYRIGEQLGKLKDEHKKLTTEFKFAVKELDPKDVDKAFKEFVLDKLPPVSEAKAKLQAALDKREKDLKVLEPWVDKLLQVYAALEDSHKGMKQAEKALKVLAKLVSIVVAVAASEPATVTAAAASAGQEIGFIAVDKIYEEGSSKVSERVAEFLLKADSKS